MWPISLGYFIYTVIEDQSTANICLFIKYIVENITFTNNII